MRMLRYLLAVSLLGGLCGIAKADDFQMVVIDPTVPSYLINHIFSDNFSFSFPSSGPQAGCQPSQLDGLSPTTYIGCFTGENNTGAPLTSLQLLIPVFFFNGALDQPACAKVSQDIFTTITCGFTSDNKDYFVDFSGGSIPAGVVNGSCARDFCSGPSIFTIAEAGIPPADFPDNIPVVANAAPEPNSLMLLSTGVLSTGFFLADWRRRMLSPIRARATHN